jgi:hypothetical protein
LVEQRTENPRVGGSIPSLAILPIRRAPEGSSMKPRSFAGLFAVVCGTASASSTHVAPGTHGPDAGLTEADTIRGIVFDSLQHGSLVGATVLA